MTASDKPNSAAEQKRTERLDEDADWVIHTRCDIRGRLIAQDDLRPEQGDPESGLTKEAAQHDVAESY
jgi:hypothetical protein